MNGPVTCVDSDATPSVADFLADATDRLEEATTILAARERLTGFAGDHGDTWTIPLDNAVHALSRAVAALGGALRTHASPDRGTAS